MIDFLRLLPNGSTSASRCGGRALLTLLVMAALAVGPLGFGHHHGGDEAVEEHHCGVCQLQQTSLGLTPEVARAPVDLVVSDRIHFLDSDQADFPPFQLSPPLRGPPSL